MTTRMKYVVAWAITAAVAFVGTLVGGPVVGALAAGYADLRNGSTLQTYRSFGAGGFGPVVDVAAGLTGIGAGVII